MATPPFSIATTSPADSDVESAFPAVERTYRDVVNSWLTLLSDPTTGLLKTAAMPSPLYTSTDAGATIGPVADLFRNSASPAATDIIGGFRMTGKDSAGNTETYGQWATRIDDPVNTSEDSTLVGYVMQNGTLVSNVEFGSTGGSIYWNDSGATVGPTFDLKRLGSSAAADDVLGSVRFFGPNSVGTQIQYASFTGEIKVETNGAERGRYVTNVWDTGALRRCQTITYGGNTLEPDLSTLSYTINQAGGTNFLNIRGGNNGNGGTMYLYGEGHASAAGDFYLLSGGSSRIGYDASNPGGTGAAPLRFSGDAYFSNIIKLFRDGDRVGLDSNSVGIYFDGNSGQMFSSSTGCPLFLNSTADTTLLSFRNDATQEGSVSVSGTTVSYNAFMGSHWAEIVGPKPLPWTIMETVDEPSRFTERDNLRLPKAKIATIGSRGVYGVYGWEATDEEGTKDYVPALGAGFIRIHPDEAVHIGDLIEAGPEGCGIVQKGDIFAAGTVAKVTATYHVADYEDGSYVVPATLHCG